MSIPQDPNGPLRIAIFTFSYAPVLTGIATGLHQRLIRLLQRGHQVLLVHPQIDEQYSDAVRNRTMVGYDGLEYPNLVQRTYPTRPHLLNREHPEPRRFTDWDDAALVADFRPDIQVVVDPAGMRGLSSLLLRGYGRPVGYKFAQLTGIPTVGMYETDWIAYAEKYFGRILVGIASPLAGYLNRRFTAAYDCTYFTSRYLLTKLSRFGHANCQPLTYHGVDCQRFHPNNIQFDPMPDDSSRVILFVGRIAPEKNVSVLLKAFRDVERAIPDALLVMVGSGPMGPKIAAEAQRLGRRIRVWGEAHGDSLRGLFARAAVFANPSVTENFCTTNLEALASGTPVVAAGAGGNCEQIEEGVNGYLSRPNDPRDMAKKLIVLLNDENNRREFARRARESSLNFDIEACVDRLEADLRDRVGRSQSKLGSQVPACERT